MNHLLKIITISLIVYGCNGKFESTQESANLIIDALHRYKQDRGFFPEKMQEIYPLYLDKIPKSAYDDREFIYEKSRDSYQLVYLGAFGAVATYNSTTKEWTYDD